MNCHISYKPQTTTGKKDGVSNPTLDCLCKSEQLRSDDPAEKRGYYYTPNLDPKAEAPYCSPCPIGASCNKNGLVLEELQSKQQFWRNSKNSSEFVDCATAYVGDYGKTLAKERCVGHLVNKSNVGSIWKSDQQCATHYRGPLCASCYKIDFVKDGDTCIPCKTGSNFAASIIATATTGFVLGTLHYILLKCLSRLKKMQKRAPPGNASRWMSQLKTIIMFGQIIQSLPASFDHIEWPVNFVNFSLNLRFFNLDFLPIFTVASCRLIQPPLEAFIIHMGSVPMFAVFIWLAYMLSTCSRMNKMNKLDFARQKEMTVKVVIFIFQLMYPGMSAHIFRIFDCREIPGTSHLRHKSDLEMICYQGRHIVFVVLAVVFIFLVVIGFPLGVFLILKKNRKHLYDKTSPKHHEIAYEFGPLYMTYEEHMWYFEVIKILVSCFDMFCTIL